MQQIISISTPKHDGLFDITANVEEMVEPSEAIPIIVCKMGLSTSQNFFFRKFNGPKNKRAIVATIQNCNS